MNLLKIEGLIIYLEKMIKEMKNIYEFYKKNKNVSFEKIFLNLIINFKKYQFKIHKILKKKYFVCKKFFENTKYLFSNINKDKKTYF